MVKRILLMTAMAGIYMWIRRLQAATTPTRKEDDTTAEATWANEGGNSPSPSV
jgi:hypothetical protein